MILPPQSPTPRRLGIVLAALAATAAARADGNFWTNIDGDFSWNGSNWNDPTFWNDGDDAIFDGQGLGVVAITGPVSAHSLTVTAPGYAIKGGNLTFVGPSPFIDLGSDLPLAASLRGTDGLTIQGNSLLTLRGDTNTPAGNSYTGGTHIRGGTVMMQVDRVATSGSAYAIDSIESLDAGATVKYFNGFDGVSNLRIPEGQLPTTGAVTPNRLNLTGGTFDLNGDDNQNRQPVPSGTGIIINSSPYARAVLKMTGYGDTRVFAGSIVDGGTVASSPVAGKLSYRTEVDFAAGSGTLVLAGSNSFTGFIRIAPGGATIRLSGAGTLGYPATENQPGRHIIHNGGLIDLNGTSQNVGVWGGSSGGTIANNAPGTYSVIRLGVNATNQAYAAAYNGKIVDSTTGTGGVLAISKVGINVQDLTATGANAYTYSGDTEVTGGTLRLSSLAAVSKNSHFRLYRGDAALDLNFNGTADVRGLSIDGVAMPNGLYDRNTAPITGSGALRVIGNLEYEATGSDITFSWVSESKLQYQDGGVTGAWTDYPDGGFSPVSVPIETLKRAVFFRLAPR